MRRFICSNCEAEGEPGDAYCNECGWDGLIFVFDRATDKYQPGDTFSITEEGTNAHDTS